MTVKGITLDFFRNYVHLDARFHPGVNVIYGDNAQGKTNLLEAIAYLSTASSHRARYDREMIQFGVDHAFAEGRGAPGGTGTSRWRCPLAPWCPEADPVQRRAAESGGGAVRDTQHCAVLPGGPVPHPGGRRQPGGSFWTTASASSGPGTPRPSRSTTKLKEHKLRILRDCGEHPDLLDTLDDFYLRMAQCGAMLIHYRAHFIRRLRETRSSHPRGTAPAGQGGAGAAVSRRCPPSPTRQRSPKELLPQLLEHQESAPAGGAGRTAVPVRAPQGRSGRGHRRKSGQGLRLPGTDPDGGAGAEAGGAGDILRGRRASGRCCCWTTCSASWTAAGRNLSSTASPAVRCSLPAARKRS